MKKVLEKNWFWRLFIISLLVLGALFGDADVYGSGY